MRRTSTNPTIKDVALACGVSEATVSYVINGKRVLRADTRERVNKAIREMNYHPSAVARGLSSKRMHTLGVLLGAVDPVDFMVNTYASGLLQGIVTQSQREGFNVTLFTERWKDVESSASAYRDGRTDGLIVVGPQIGSDIVSGLFDFGVPLVAISAEATVQIPVVDVDNEMGARLAVGHLIELGHRRIAHLTGNDNLASFLPRVAGYRAALSEAGIEFNDRYLAVSDFNGSLAAEQLRSMLALPEPPTAVFASNDLIAFAVIETAKSLGIDVPGQLSVVGFDDMPQSSYVTPALTTVWQPLAEIGIAATKLLIEHRTHHERTDYARPVLLPPRLIVRASTSAPQA